MNMKKMMLLAAATLAGALVADVSVEDVKCTQRYPWNGLVDIEYTIACDDPNAEIYVNPVGFNGDTGLTVFPTHFTGDGATNTVKAGKHTMVWDAKADLGNLFSSKNFQIKMYAGKKLSRYIVIDISGGTEAENYPIRHSIEGPNLADDTCRTTEIWMRLIPPGTFMMGSPEDEVGRATDEDLHKVTLTKPFYIGVFEVTQRQWELIKGDRPSYFKNDYETRPVENVNHDVIRSVCNSTHPVGSGSFLGILQKKLSASGFDLPTEAQWEYACRAGTQSAIYMGEELSGLRSCQEVNNLCRYYYNGYNGSGVNNGMSTSESTAKVGSYQPNGFGLYDMYGNVSEICNDSKIDQLGTAPQVDPLFYTKDYKVGRGGCWQSKANVMRSGCRGDMSVFTGSRYNTVGFRLACTGSLDH